MIEVPLDRSSKIPLYEQIATHLERMINTGSISYGTRLPGSREMALSLGVSRTTVIRAYEYLEDHDLIVQKGRSGAYVRGSELQSIEHESSEELLLDMKSGTPSSELIPAAVLSKLSREILLDKGEHVLRSAPAGGLVELKRTLVMHAASRGIPASWKEVVVTTGGLESLSLSMRALKNLGVKRILVEELTYPEALSIAESLGYEMDLVCFDRNTIDAQLSTLSGSDVIYLVPSFQNPTGRTLTQATRSMILNYSTEKGFWVIEDDAYGELRYGESSVPAMKAMRGSSRVIYSSSFSQPLFPGLRLGYALVPEKMAELFTDLQSVTTGPVSSLVQFIVLDFIRDGSLVQALDIARATIHDRMYSLGEFLKDYLPACKYTVPLGGIYIWVETPGIDGDDAEKRALDNRIAICSGNTFCWTERRIEAVRLSVSTLNRVQLRDAVRKLRNAWPELS